jgi:hypothetical protein
MSISEASFLEAANIINIIEFEINLMNKGLSLCRFAKIASI